MFKLSISVQQQWYKGGGSLMVRTRQKMWVQFAALLLGSERSEKWLYLLFYEI